MKFSQAIREGKYPWIQDVYVTWDEERWKINGCCPMVNGLSALATPEDWAILEQTTNGDVWSKIENLIRKYAPEILMAGPYTCPICQATKRDIGNLIVHLADYHGLKNKQVADQLEKMDL